MRLENWEVTCTGSVWGEIHEDVRNIWKDGHLVRVSRARNAGEVPIEGEVYKTMNSEYLMGKERK
jgi:hypothetical protein